MPENLAKNSFSHVIFPGISVFCAPWENWAKLLALGKCKKKIQGNRQKSAKIPKFFSKKPLKIKIWRKMYVDNAVKSTWASHFYDHRYLKREQLKIGTFLGNNDFCDLFTILSLIFDFLIIFGKKNKNFSTIFDLYFVKNSNLFSKNLKNLLCRW